MEQSATFDTLKFVTSPRQHRTSEASSQSTPRLVNAEPNPDPPNIEQLSEAIVSLRFPKPLGNRQLTNWISSSQPDIMQRGNMADQDLSLADLGYDIIGTDGESQAESTTSSFDYQKPDDMDSLASTDVGTDVDTDSSDDEDAPLEETTILDVTVVEESHHDETNEPETSEPETLNMVNHSLENPTNLSLPNLPPSFTMSSYVDRIRPHDLTPVTWDTTVAAQDPSFAEPNMLIEDLQGEKDIEQADPYSPKRPSSFGVVEIPARYLSDKRRVFFFVSGLILVSSLALAAKSVLFQSSVLRELSTVPVASVSVVQPSFSADTTYLVTNPNPTISQTAHALQTAGSSNGLKFIPFGKEKISSDAVPDGLADRICSADLSGRDEITIRIPQEIKSAWLAHDALQIAVSRGLEDIPTKVSRTDEGLLITVPSEQAYGVVVVTLATTRKPRINESFRINFGTYRFTEALDVGKQLVRGFAQKVVDTVNETTSWVEETYSPAFDVVSKQVCGVCDQTASISNSVLHGLQEAGDAVLSIPRRLATQIHNSLRGSGQSVLRRASQAQLELTRQTQDVQDQLRITMLKCQLQSKLLWLKMQGKPEAYGDYVSKAEKHWREQRARVDSARVERAERTKQQIRAWQERDHPAAPNKKAPIWRMGLVGLGWGGRA